MSANGLDGDAAGKRLADLFQKEMEENINRQVVLMGKLHYGECYGDPCPGCEAAKPPPPSRRERSWRWVRRWFWYRPWAFVHRALPGECECGHDEW